MKDKLKNKPEAIPYTDVCLITEGTYPFITGGVSSWIHSIIKAMPDITFSILHISQSNKENAKFRYDLPDNVIAMVNISLHDYILHKNKTPGKHNRKDAVKDIYKFHKDLKAGSLKKFPDLYKHLCSNSDRSLNTKEIVESKDTWDIVLKLYQEHGRNSSFIDYFWTWRFMHLPMFQILNGEIPDAAVYHAVSTGYAGLIGVVAKLKKEAPLLLTEHGIYTKERFIEIRRSDWIYSDLEMPFLPQRSQGLLKDMWQNFFLFLSKLTYQYADEIITLYSGNQELQIKYGADREKCTVIPNAVNTKVFYPLRKNISRGKIKRVGFVGRVVPIKDVKTFIKACRLVAEKLDQNVEFLILGPTDEDEEYYDDCLHLVKLLNIGGQVKFHGRVDVRKYYPVLDVNVLTSISEGQPLTILEAMAVGVPSVATNVGACEDLIYGHTKEDKAMGPGGVITNIGRPKETADAILQIISDEKLHQKMVQSGYNRVEKYYRQELLIKKYKDLYTTYKYV